MVVVRVGAAGGGWVAMVMSESVSDASEKRFLTHQIYGDAGCLTTAQAEAIIPEANFHRVAERSEPQHFDWLPFEQTHLQEPLNQDVAAGNGLDTCSLADPQLVQGWHQMQSNTGASGVA
jgi:hypothetical protein